MTEKQTQVQEQYTKWPYPEPVYDLQEWFKTNRLMGDFTTDLGFYAHFPRERKRPLNVLVAGCGSYQAAAYAFRSHESCVTGIDISSTSLSLTDDLKKKHKLTNLELKELSLLDAETLGEKFDLIISTGVLHHLEDPVQGARALASVLSEKGRMSLMLYGSSLRTGVYWIQDVFRTLRIQPHDDADIERARSFVSALPGHHPVHQYVKAGATDLRYSGGFVDTFFHPQDRSYFVSDLFEFAQQSNLIMSGFIENAFYHPLTYQLGTSLNLYAKELGKLSFFERAAIVDKLSNAMGTHRFILSKEKVFTLNEQYPPEDFDHAIPMIAGIEERKDLETGGRVVQRKPFPAVTLTDQTLYVVQLFDGKRNCGDIVKMMQRQGIPDKNTARLYLHKVIKDLWEYGFVVFVG